MATIVNMNCDIFSLNTIDEVTVSVDHSLGNLIRSIARNEDNVQTCLDLSGRPSPHGNKVSIIKFVRASLKDSGNNALGLRDAKDIADHYYSTRQQN